MSDSARPVQPGPRSAFRPPPLRRRVRGGFLWGLAFDGMIAVAGVVTTFFPESPSRLWDGTPLSRWWMLGVIVLLVPPTFALLAACAPWMRWWPVGLLLGPVLMFPLAAVFRMDPGWLVSEHSRLLVAFTSIQLGWMAAAAMWLHTRDWRQDDAT